jgi:undecaprenyl-diphosphatase
VKRLTASLTTGAVAGLAGSTLVASRRRVPGPEAAVFRRFNDATDTIRRPLWVIMQAGTLGAVVVAAAGTWRRHSARDGMIVLLAGSGAWIGMKRMKPLVGRGRPDHYLADVNIRGATQSGLGYPSGHAAVAMTLALTTTSHGPARSAAVAVALAASCGRMYSGAHLPLDVVGGLAAGALNGMLARHAIEHSVAAAVGR